MLPLVTLIDAITPLAIFADKLKQNAIDNPAIAERR
jgi:hypothetical protein